jgi:hypothetical protein
VSSNDHLVLNLRIAWDETDVEMVVIVQEADISLLVDRGQNTLPIAGLPIDYNVAVAPFALHVDPAASDDRSCKNDGNDSKRVHGVLPLCLALQWTWRSNSGSM